MAGVLTQLWAIGRQDQDTMIQPNITFWKSVYQRHTPFAIEPKNFEFQSVPGWGLEACSTLQRVGDLITKLYLQINLGNLDNSSGTLAVGNGGAR